MTLVDNLNKEWDSVVEAAMYYAEWLDLDLVEVLNDVNGTEGINDQIRIFDLYFSPKVFLKYKKPRWAMYGYEEGH